MIKINIRLFAALKAIVGKDDIELAVPENSTIRDAVSIMESKYPEIKNITAISRFALNMEYTDAGATLSGGDELTIIMPVSGGVNMG